MIALGCFVFLSVFVYNYVIENSAREAAHLSHKIRAFNYSFIFLCPRIIMYLLQYWQLSSTLHIVATSVCRELIFSIKSPLLNYCVHMAPLGCFRTNLRLECILNRNISAIDKINLESNLKNQVCKLYIFFNMTGQNIMTIGKL